MERGEKHEDYYRQTRGELVELIPEGAERLLEVGCGAGHTGRLAKLSRGVREAVGVEAAGPAARAARANLDRVIEGSVEEVALDFPEGYFDCILCGDVLEHTRDPWAVLRRLRPLLADDGALVASIPNVQHLKPVLKIVLDRFEYEDEGILDRTHLRFFTLSTIRGMFAQTGYRLAHVGHKRSRKLAALNALSLGLLHKFTVFQYLVVAKKSGR